MTEALRGWRAWQVLEGPEGPELYSWAHAVRWPAGTPLQARCNRHLKPTAHHSCGIHAFDDAEAALAYAQPRPRVQLFVKRPERALAIAVGVVSGWGRSIRHTRGWRSQFAYPYDLYLLRGDRGIARALSDLYVVETSPFPPIRST